MELTDREKEMLSMVASDLLTGNHLLGRKRETDYKDFLQDILDILSLIEKEETITARQRFLILELSNMFHDGIDDMLEQLLIDKTKFYKAINSRTDAFTKSIAFLRRVYENDFNAVATIVTAEADCDTDIVISYLDCIIDYAARLRNELRSENDEEE